MLVVHGNRDYRVPVSEALRLWWDLVSRFPGPPEDLPHRFLQFTGENHWILSPGNAEVWYDTLLDARLKRSADFATFAGLTVINAGRRYGSASPERKAVADAWAKVGIKITIKSDPTVPEWIADMESLKYPATAGQLNFGPAYLYWTGSLNGSFNLRNNSDPQLTDWANQAAAADPKAADKLWQKLFAGLTDKAWFVPVLRSYVVYFTSKTVSVPPPGQAIVINPADIAVAG